jgi:tRNA-splicing ligase RtcB
MISKGNLQKISDWIWEIPKSFRADMRVPARLYTGGELMEKIFRDRSLSQLVNVTSLPGIVRHGLAMPDVHEGYGFPIGGVAAVEMESGVISPGGVGYDINCGMRLLKSDHKVRELRDRIDTLAEEIQAEVPSGLGRGRRKKFDLGFIDKILEAGAAYLVEQGFGTAEDLTNCEERGGFRGSADPAAVSARSKSRGRDQVGTLGSGNHFCEIQEVDEIFYK